jgi:hypothetical protein
MDTNCKKIIYYFFISTIFALAVYFFYLKRQYYCELLPNKAVIVLLAGFIFVISKNYFINRYIDIKQNIYLVVLLMLIYCVILYALMSYLISYFCI